ncbi:enoyl-CoA hydratase/isomerase family protein [Novosphingobium sp. 9U]|uniref:enoyl-CoA hydratase/isomerase family protein n=1 Tax=Novosphingobium sp. 9U TaxID=2653158 RepID=UPI0012EFB857|nr:enoyl-CoA hydratase/isomerase family protein [Novosphingobium sp. 9U]VWX50593.1 Enoyl-CoA hydratase [Novosphingobium sp. 9U]
MITLERRGAVARIALDRPQAGNALNAEMGARLVEIARECDHDDTIRCVTLTGNGKHFCAGGDISLMASAGPATGATVSGLAGIVHQTVSYLARMRKPLLTVVNGPAAGAGLGLALLGDIVIAAPSAHFSMGYPAIGLTPDGGATWLLPRLIGLRRAQEMTLTNRRVGAEEALAIGLITELAADEATLTTRSDAIAQQLVAQPVAAVGTVRSLLLESYGRSLETHLEYESRGIAAAAAGREGQEGLRAYLEKRKPDFTSC